MSRTTTKVPELAFVLVSVSDWMSIFDIRHPEMTGRKMRAFVPLWIARVSLGPIFARGESQVDAARRLRLVVLLSQLMSQVRLL